MNIQNRNWAIGSLLSADSNSQSFHSPNWQSGTRRRSQEPALSGNDSVSIDTHTAFGSLNNSATTTVGTAITLSQTQDGFLKKVQESLQRMSELSALAQGDSESDIDRLTHATEFAQLQNRIKDLGAKMVRAATLLQPVNLGISIEREVSASPEGSAAIGSGSIDACLQGSSDPGVTAINNVTSASAAIATIDNALKAVKDMRGAMGTTIQRLGQAGEQLAALSYHLSSNKRRIRDVNVADQSTRFARYDILVRSGTAMLAQANALPHSALRLLD